MNSRRLPTDSNAQRSRRPWLSLQYCSQWVTTADGCVHTDDTTKLSPISCKFVYTPPTRRDSTVSSRRRRRCVLGLTVQECWQTNRQTKSQTLLKTIPPRYARYAAQVVKIINCFRSWIKGAFVLEVLLGLTWAFGLAFVNEQTVIFAYIFTVLNSLQGAFIFVFHCIMNEKVNCTSFSPPVCLLRRLMHANWTLNSSSSHELW